MYFAFASRPSVYIVRVRECTSNFHALNVRHRAEISAEACNLPVPGGDEKGQTVRISMGNKELFITFKTVTDTVPMCTPTHVFFAQAVLSSIREHGVLVSRAHLSTPASVSVARGLNELSGSTSWSWNGMHH
ncbi:uncharacterized protein LOC134215676 [Armigeres subalbatus]|uniref:uncharacterized protein LOC134215676 n=1 Tax=Armigeres subalbatus TaxID=124917 RepID=UPI002ED33C67